MLCEHNGCESEAVTKKFGNLCLKHYKRFNRHGTTDLVDRQFYKDKKCEHCSRKVGEKGGRARGMCNRHYQNWIRHGDPLYTDKIRAEKGANGYEKRIGGKVKHRLIYEDYIGRELVREDVIHHINLDKTDNRLENLYLCNGQSEHSFLHRQLEKLAGQLVKSGVILFDCGEYKIVQQLTKVQNDWQWLDC